MGALLGTVLGALGRWGVAWGVWSVLGVLGRCLGCWVVGVLLGVLSEWAGLTPGWAWPKPVDWRVGWLGAGCAAPGWALRGLGLRAGTLLAEAELSQLPKQHPHTAAGPAFILKPLVAGGWDCSRPGLLKVGLLEARSRAGTGLHPAAQADGARSAQNPHCPIWTAATRCGANRGLPASAVRDWSQAAPRPRAAGAAAPRRASVRPASLPRPPPPHTPAPRATRRSASGARGPPCRRARSPPGGARGDGRAARGGVAVGHSVCVSAGGGGRGRFLVQLRGRPAP
jgi:hypothetical protein